MGKWWVVEVSKAVGARGLSEKQPGKLMTKVKRPLFWMEEEQCCSFQRQIDHHTMLKNNIEWWLIGFNRQLRLDKAGFTPTWVQFKVKNSSSISPSTSNKFCQKNVDKSGQVYFWNTTMQAFLNPSLITSAATDFWILMCFFLITSHRVWLVVWEREKET